MQHHDNLEQHEERGAPGFGRNTGGTGILIVTLVAILMALAAWWLWKDGKEEVDHYRFSNTASHDGGHGEGHGAAEKATGVLDPASLGKYDSLSGNFIYSLGDDIIITLPDSAKTELRVGANSTEARLYKFLVEAGIQVDTVDKTKGWITCDRIYFETSKAVLTPESKRQIGNIALIMKAFPAAELKVGGYTDSTGNAAENMTLSASRAAHVLELLKADGAKGAMSSEGYGSQWPIATNTTPEGRALNRRTDIRVVKK